MYTIEQIKTTVESKGYKWFNDDSGKGFDVNIIGVRNNSTSGMYSHTNVIRGKVDMFPQQELIDMLLSL